MFGRFHDIAASERRASDENPLWGAPRIHGELLKLGFEVAQSSVAKYMVKRSWPPSQGWRTFLRNHSPDIAAMDLFVAPTLGFDLLYAFIIVRLARRDLVWINVTPHPTADWIARQITEAFPWNEAPRYLIRDRDQVYGVAVRHRLRAMGMGSEYQPIRGRRQPFWVCGRDSQWAAAMRYSSIRSSTLTLSPARTVPPPTSGASLKSRADGPSFMPDWASRPHSARGRGDGFRGGRHGARLARGGPGPEYLKSRAPARNIA